MPRPKGTPEKLNAEVQQAICESLKIGLPAKYAAEDADVSERTLRYWCQLGESGIEPYAAFLAAVTQARARGAKNLLTRALKGERGSSAAMWTLERSYRPEFGANVMISGTPNGNPIRVENDTTDTIRQSREANKLIHQAIVAAAQAALESGDAKKGKAGS
jgi:hypothetical protein